MGEFYSLLRKYNETLVSENLPEWTKIYLESEPPTYWVVLSKILTKYSKGSSVFEIGSGAGDIVALLRNLDFSNVIGIESDEKLARIANKKIESLFNVSESIIHDKYPIVIEKTNILIQVNCVYFENINSKQEYLNQLVTYYQNANPDVYFLEVIDNSFTESSKIFPEYVKISEKDIISTFKNKKIESFITYQFPKNTSTKRLYVIS